MKFGTSSLRCFILFCIAVSATVSCSKKQQQAQVTLSFGSGQNGAFTTNYKIENIILQEEDGKSPHFYKEWNCEFGDCDGLVQANGRHVISFETQKSKDRALQLLIIAEVDDGSGTENMGVFYSGARYDLGQPVVMELQEVENEADMAIMSGRYVPGDLGGGTAHELKNKFLTGHLNVYVKSSSLPGFGIDLPKMKILESEIFGGFTNIFIFKDIPTYYEFSGVDQAGTKYNQVRVMNDLHPGEAGLTTNSVGIAAYTTERTHYNLTGGLYYDERDGVWMQRHFIERIFGFFGSNPDGRYLCAEDDPAGNEFDGDDSERSLCANSGCSTYKAWSDISVDGVLDGSGDTCSDNDALNVELMDISEEGGAIDFFGPFSGQATTGSVDFDEDSATLMWHWDPNVVSSGAVAGVEIFVRTANSNFNKDDIRIPKGHGYDCGKLKDHQFELQGGGLQSTAITSLTIDDPTDLQDEDFAMAVCFKRPDGSYYQTAHIEGDDGGHGGGPPAAVRLVKEPSIDGHSGIMFNNTCYPMEISLIDDSNNRTHSDTPYNVSLADSSSGLFYSDITSCNASSAPISSVHVNWKKIVYFRHNIANGSTGSLTASSAASGLDPSSFGYQSSTTGTPSHAKILTDFYRNTNKFEMADTELCVPFYIGIFADADPDPAVTKLELISGSSDTVTVGNSSGDLAGVSSSTVHYDSSTCEAGSSPVTGGSSTNYPLSQYWARLGATGGGTLSGFITGMTGTPLAYNDRTMPVVVPTDADRFETRIDTDVMQPGNCTKVVMSFVEDNKDHYPVVFPESGSVTFGYVAGEPKNYLMYSDNTCSSLIDHRTAMLGVSGGGASGPQEIFISPQGGSEVSFEAAYTASGVNVGDDDGRSVSGLSTFRLYAHTGPGDVVHEFADTASGGGTDTVTITLEDLSGSGMVVSVTFSNPTNFGFAAGGAPGDSGMCSGSPGSPSIPAGGSCNLMLQFNPSSSIAHESSVIFDSSGTVGKMHLYGQGL